MRRSLSPTSNAIPCASPPAARIFADDARRAALRLARDEHHARAALRERSRRAPPRARGSRPSPAPLSSNVHADLPPSSIARGRAHRLSALANPLASCQSHGAWSRARRAPRPEHAAAARGARAHAEPDREARGHPARDAGRTSSRARQPDARVLQRVADAFQVSLEELVAAPRADARALREEPRCPSRMRGNVDGAQAPARSHPRHGDRSLRACRRARRWSACRTRPARASTSRASAARSCSSRRARRDARRRRRRRVSRRPTPLVRKSRRDRRRRLLRRRARALKKTHKRRQAHVFRCEPVRSSNRYEAVCGMS